MVLQGHTYLPTSYFSAWLLTSDYWLFIPNSSPFVLIKLRLQVELSFLEMFEVFVSRYKPQRRIFFSSTLGSHK